MCAIVILALIIPIIAIRSSMAAVTVRLA